MRSEAAEEADREAILDLLKANSNRDAATEGGEAESENGEGDGLARRSSSATMFCASVASTASNRGRSNSRSGQQQGKQGPSRQRKSRVISSLQTDLTPINRHVL
jgi:hypothetical protein